MPVDFTHRISLLPGSWYSQDDPVTLTGNTFEGSLTYTDWGGPASPSAFLELHTLPEWSDPYADMRYVKRATSSMSLTVEFPGLDVDGNGLPVTSDGRSVVALFKINGSVEAMPQDASEETLVPMAAGYFACNLGYDQGVGTCTVPGVPSDATSMTVATIYLDAYEIIREDTYTLDLTCLPE